MIYEEKVSENRLQFIEKVQDIATKLKIRAEWLMIMMYNESGLNHRAFNPMGGATGLIQFMPATAKGLGTTTDALQKMTNVAQLDYVYKYFKPFTGRIKSFYDLYLINFMPISLGKPDNWVIQCKGLSAETVAKYNPVFDLDKNKQITVGEFKAYIDKKYGKVLKSI